VSFVALWCLLSAHFCLLSAHFCLLSALFCDRRIARCLFDTFFLPAVCWMVSAACCLLLFVCFAHLVSLFVYVSGSLSVIITCTITITITITVTITITKG
jgi:hypothetical protein